MNAEDVAALIRPAVESPGETWVDLGAGTGAFTRALAALLGPDGRVYAVDRDRRAVAELQRLSSRATSRDGAVVTPILADLTAPLALAALDGALLANSLHYVPDDEQGDVLALAASYLRPGGRIVVVEYEGRSPSRWVPFPVSSARLRALAAEAGLTEPVVVGKRPSAFGGTVYSAVSRARRD